MEVVEVLLVEPTSVVEMAAEDSLTEFFVLYPQAEKKYYSSQQACVNPFMHDSSS